MELLSNNVCDDAHPNDAVKLSYDRLLEQVAQYQYYFIVLMLSLNRHLGLL